MHDLVEDVYVICCHECERVVLTDVIITRIRRVLADPGYCEHPRMQQKRS